MWQNIILSDIPEAEVAAAEAAIAELGFGTTAHSIRGALVACTGNTGCKFAASDTKGHAMMLADHLERRIALDQPVNIHLTGCPHSCAQHFVADIGLLGVKVGDDMIEGYSIFVGGGAGTEQRIGRELFPQIAMEEMPARIEAMLRAYLDQRRAGESFQNFVARHSVDELKTLLAPAPAMAIKELVS